MHDAWVTKGYSMAIIEHFIATSTPFVAASITFELARVQPIR